MGAEKLVPFRASAISADELKRMISSRREREFMLVDVREPQEYKVGHLPGARLLPLSEFEHGPPPPDLAPYTVLYCYTGVRSKRAADQLARVLSREGIYALDGGLNAWRGTTVQDFPNVHVFDGVGTLRDVLLRALDLEKGAHRLYEMLCEHFASSRIRPALQELLEAEVAHGRQLYRSLQELDPDQTEPFESFYMHLTGDIVENGAYLDEMLLVASEIEGDEEAALLELALGVEYMAYDLYRNLSHRMKDDDQRKVFVALAEHEKQHVHHVLRALDDLARG
ncbi:MAG: rhodanese-like domain-containing protein [Myxococcota bacterium]